MIVRRFKWFYVVSILLLPSYSVSMEISDVENLIEASGYHYIEHASGIEKLSSGSYVLRVYLEEKDGHFEKSVIVVVNDSSITPIDDPVWAGGGVQIEVLDINSDGDLDIVVGEDYEPTLNVRIFFNGGKMIFNKVLQQYSATMPEFIELGEYFGVMVQVKEVILTKDPYNSQIDSLFCSTLYAFNGRDYQQVPITD